MNKIRIFITISCCFWMQNMHPQHGYQRDSLQIKVYAEIEYVNNKSKEIKVKKVFCGYCTDNQTAFIKEKAEQLAFYDRYNPKKRLVNGLRKFAIIIRVSKKDFLALKTEEE